MKEALRQQHEANETERNVGTPSTKNVYVYTNEHVFKSGLLPYYSSLSLPPCCHSFSFLFSLTPPSPPFLPSPTLPPSPTHAVPPPLSKLNAAKIKLLEQERKINDLEFQLNTHKVSLTMLQADQQHAHSSISQDMTNQIPSSGCLLPRRPMSAGSDGSGGACRKPKYHFLNRGQTSSRNSLMQVCTCIHYNDILHILEICEICYMYIVYVYVHVHVTCVKVVFFSDQTEFAIQIPGTKGGSLGGSEIVNLEEHTETQHSTLSLGPAVVTDDESSGFVQLHHKHEHDDSQMDKVGKHQQIKKIRRHRRTASTGSNVVSFPQKELTSSTLSKPLQHVNIVKPKPVSAKQHPPNRPGSAGSNPVMEFHRAQSPVQIKETAHEVTKGITKLISDGGDVSVVGGDGGGGGGGDSGNVGERSMRMRRVRSSGMRLADGMSDTGDVGTKGSGEGESGTKQDHQALKTSLTSSLPLGIGSKVRHKHEIPRNKPSGKVAPAEATEATATSDPPPTTSSSRKIPGIGSSKPSTTGWLRPLRIFSGSLNKEKSGAGSGGGASTDTKTTSDPPHTTTSVASGGSSIDSPSATSTAASTVAATHSKLPPTLATDLSRTPSILSTSSTISTFPPSTLPSRNPSFAYDGGGESSPHSLESVEIGDSIENLLKLQSGRMNFAYFIPIRTAKDSSSDEDSVRGYRHSRRKRSSGTTTDTTAHSTQQSKGAGGLLWFLAM